MATNLMNTKQSLLKKMTILVIEDDLVSRIAIKKVLENSDFVVLEACNGREGFTAFMETSPDLVLMDVIMQYLTT